MSDGHTTPRYTCKAHGTGPVACCKQAKLQIISRPHRTTVFE